MAGISGTELPLAIELPIEMELPSADPEYRALLFVRGLPDPLSLSAGVRSGDIWVVSLKDIARLRLISPPDYRGRFPLELLLVRGDRSLVGQQGITVDLQPAPLETGSGEYTGSIGDAVPPADAAGLSAAQEAILLKRGKELMAQGTLAPARLIFQELAKMGSAKGAYALGQTYDPAFIKETPISGMQPDLATAQRWYERALQLGSEEAVRRLAEIAAER